MTASPGLHNLKFIFRKLFFKKVILLPFIYLITGIAFAQNSKIIFGHLTVKNGLSSDITRCVFQDSRRFIWVSTTDGLNRFDGTSFKNFFHSDDDVKSVCDNNTGCIVEDANSNLLIATAKGVSIYIPSENDFKTIPLPIDKNSTGKGIIRLCVDRHHHTWVTTRFEVFELDSAYHFIRRYKDELYGGDLIYDVKEDSRGNIWIDKLECMNMLDTRNNIIYNKKNNPLQKAIFNTQLASFSFDSSGNMWGTKNYKLMQFNAAGDEINDIPIPTHAEKIFITAGNKIWLNDDGKGMLLYNPLEKTFTTYYHNPDDKESLSGIFVTQVIEDNTGNTWFSTDKALDFLPHRRCSFNILFNAKDAAGDDKSEFHLEHFLIDENKLWLMVWGKGLFCVDIRTREKQFYKPDKTGSDNFFWDLIKINDELWFGNFHGIHSLDLSTRTISDLKKNPSYLHEIDSLGVIKFFRDKDSNIWISLFGENGILKYDVKRNSFTRFTQASKGKLFFPFRHFDGVAQDDRGRIWMGYKQSEGLILFDSTKNQFGVMTINGVPVFNQQVNCLLADKNTLWIGSNSGLYKMNLSDYEIKKYTREKGLINNNVSALALDGDGNLWIGTEGGLSLLEPLSEWVSNFTVDDGLPENRIENILFETKSGCMYFSDGDNIFYTNTGSVEKQHPTLSPGITSFSVMGTEKYFSADSTIKLKYSDKYFSFELAAPLFPSSENNQYQYKLDGFDKDWVSAGSRRFAGYTDLRYGEYSFHLKASPDAIHWYEMKKPVLISISAPFYLTTWFMVFVALFIMAVVSTIIYANYRIKLRGIIAAMKIRNKIASDLHDDIGSTLSSISYMSDMAKHKMKLHVPETENYLEQIGNSSRGIIENMNDIIWSVNPKNDTIESLLVRMRAFSASMLEAKNINLKFDADSRSESQKLTMEDRRNFYLIFKEVINNITKHAECRNVDIKLCQEKNKIKLSVSDDGKGFDAEKIYNGNGLINLRRRAGDLHGEVIIDSAPGNGTTVVLLI
jgi:ligand-binding sensor domain-containing protein